MNKILKEIETLLTSKKTVAGAFILLIDKKGEATIASANLNSVTLKQISKDIAILSAEKKAKEKLEAKKK